MNPPTAVLPGFSDHHSPVTSRTGGNQIYSPTDRTTEVDWGVRKGDASAGYVDRMGLKCGAGASTACPPQNTKGE
jgi:hypothetical protein